MQLRFISQIRSGTGNVSDDRVFIMFHGYGNDEHEMIRVLDAVYRHDADLASSTAALTGATAQPDYLSFRGTYDRPYMGGSYWYPDGCSVEERRRECRSVGDAIVSLLDSSVFRNRRKTLIGFSQGGYLSYRLIVEHPTLFDEAILLSPSFKGEEDSALDCATRWFLAYGGNDRTIPCDDQLTARRVLNATGHLEYHEYAGMPHAICDREIADITDFIRR